MEQLSRNEKIAYMRKNNKQYQTYKSLKSTKTFISKQKNTSIHNPTNQSTEKQHIFASFNQEENKETSSFQFRMSIASFLFLAFLGMREHNFIYRDISCETIIEMISNNNGMEIAEEKVIATFNNID